MVQKSLLAQKEDSKKVPFLAQRDHVHTKVVVHLAIRLHGGFGRVRILGFAKNAKKIWIINVSSVYKPPPEAGRCRARREQLETVEGLKLSKSPSAQKEDSKKEPMHMKGVQFPPRKVDVRLPEKGYSNSHGARPVHPIITMIKWIRTNRLSIENVDSDQ